MGAHEARRAAFKALPSGGSPLAGDWRCPTANPERNYKPPPHDQPDEQPPSYPTNKAQSSSWFM